MIRSVGQALRRHACYGNRSPLKDHPYVQLRKTITGFQPLRSVPSIYLCRDTFDIEEAKEYRAKYGSGNNEEYEMNINAHMPLNREDNELQAIERYRNHAEHAIDICGHIVSAGLAILQGRPYSPMQNSGIKAVMHMQCDAVKERILEERTAIQSELSSRSARRKALEEDDVTLQERI